MRRRNGDDGPAGGGGGQSQKLEQRGSTALAWPWCGMRLGGASCVVFGVAAGAVRTSALRGAPWLWTFIAPPAAPGGTTAVPGSWSSTSELRPPASGACRPQGRAESHPRRASDRPPRRPRRRGAQQPKYPEISLSFCGFSGRVFYPLGPISKSAFLWRCFCRQKPPCIWGLGLLLGRRLSSPVRLVSVLSSQTLV